MDATPKGATELISSYLVRQVRELSLPPSVSSISSYSPSSLRLLVRPSPIGSAILMHSLVHHCPLVYLPPILMMPIRNLLNLATPIAQHTPKTHRIEPIHQPLSPKPTAVPDSRH